MPSFDYQRGAVTRTMYYEDSRPEEFTVKTHFDAEPVLATNKALAETLDPHSMNKLVARVPMFVYEQSVREQWDDNDWKKWLNDPDNKLFRVWPGRV